MTRLGYPTFAQLAWETPTQLGTNVWATQVSMLLADAIALAALGDSGIVPDLVLGHSYGEFAALFAAGAWDLETAIRMTKARCDGITTVASGSAGMLATNASPELLESLFKTVSGVLYIANFNAPDQAVVGGKRPQLELLAKALESHSQQARILAVPAAFHTPLMAGSSRLLEQQLRGAELHPLRVPMISTVTNALVRDAAEIRRNLAAQLTTPVRYSQLIAQLAAERPTVFVEVGPQQTMTRLNRRILGNEAITIACDNPKRAGLEPLLAVQAFLDCLGVMAPSESPAMKRPAQVSTSSTSQGSSGIPTMHDNIPHFDATERRRTKMRGGAGAQPAGAANGDAPTAAPRPAVKAPASSAVAVNRLTTHTAAKSPAVPQPQNHVTTPRQPAPAAVLAPKSPPAAPVAARNGNTPHNNAVSATANGSASHAAANERLDASAAACERKQGTRAGGA